MMKRLNTFFFSLIQPNPVPTAAEKGYAQELELLLASGKYDVNAYDVGRTSLDLSVLYKHHACTVLLLKHEADPNLPIASGEFKGEKPMQHCIYDRDASTIKLLAMHGADAEGLRFLQDGQQDQQLFEATIALKQRLDNLLNQAKAESNRPLPNYSDAIEAYQAAGDIWYRLYQEETQPDYQRYYQEKALELYEHAADCFAKLADVYFPTEQKSRYRELFDRLAALYASSAKLEKAAEYAALVARLTDGLKKQAYPAFYGAKPVEALEFADGSFSQRKPMPEENEPLLYDNWQGLSL